MQSLLNVIIFGQVLDVGSYVEDRFITFQLWRCQDLGPDVVVVLFNVFKQPKAA